jgi:hypothetical protein
MTPTALNPTALSLGTVDYRALCVRTLCAILTIPGTASAQLDAARSLVYIADETDNVFNICTSNISSAPASSSVPSSPAPDGGGGGVQHGDHHHGDPALNGGGVCVYYLLMLTTHTLTCR